MNSIAEVCFLYWYVLLISLSPGVTSGFDKQIETQHYKDNAQHYREPKAHFD